VRAYFTGAAALFVFLTTQASYITVQVHLESIFNLSFRATHGAHNHRKVMLPKVVLVGIN
jgi:hypothetical protein